MYYGFGPYVSVAEKQKKAEKQTATLRKKGLDAKPVLAFKGKMAHSFWGKAWCDNLEACADYANRLERGRSYVRHGCICHLEIHEGLVEAKVSGSSLYTLRVTIKPLDEARWRALCEACAGEVGSVLELLQGKLSKKVMGIVCAPDGGMFPTPAEIAFDCSCPDWAELCKHVAAALYAIGRRLDAEPELLFTLRGVNAADLLGSGLDFSQADAAETLVSDDLSALFGIDMASELASDLSNNLASPQPVEERTPETPVASPDAASVLENFPASSPAPSATKSAKKPFNPKRPTGAGIARLRRLTGLAPVAFASKLGVTPATLNRWEAAKGVLTLRAESKERLERFQEALLNTTR